MPEPGVATNALRALLAYDEVVRANDAGRGDVLRAVAEDRDGEVYYEVFDAAADRGIDLSPFDDSTALPALIDAYQRLLADEVNGSAQ